MMTGTSGRACRVETAHARHVNVRENQNQAGLSFSDYFERLLARNPS
jgi:hypothetical protein